MSLRKIVPGTILALVLSVAAMMNLAAKGLRNETGLSAAFFVLLLIAVAIHVNRPYWRLASALPATAGEEAVPALRRNVRLFALACCWAGFAMHGVYVTSLTGLRWQHAWQYAWAMTMLAALALGYVHALGRANERLQSSLLRAAPWLALSQATGGAVVLVILTAAGKMATARSDWAANHIFLAGATLMLVLAAITFHTQWRLTHSAGRGAPDVPFNRS